MPIEVVVKIKIICQLEFCLFTSFRRLFSLKLTVASGLPMYCLLHSKHSIKYITHLLLQLSLMYFLKTLLVSGISKVLADCTSLHHKLLALELQGFEWTFQLMLWFDCFFVVHYCFFLPIISCRFLFLLKAIIGSSLKTSSKSLFIFYIFQFLFINLFISGRIRLYVSITRAQFDFVWFSQFSNCILSIMIGFEISCCSPGAWVQFFPTTATK